MNKRCLTILTLFSAVFTSCTYLPSEKALRYGAIKFPTGIEIKEPIEVFYAGERIPTEIEKDAHLVSFALLENIMRNTFCLLICNDIETVSEQNTIKFQRVCKDRPYKLYVLKFHPNKDLLKSTTDIDINAQGAWEITQKALQDDMRIPDNAIIVQYHPHLVEKVQGGNALELPKIVLNEQVLQQFTTDELHEAQVNFVLSSIDVRTYHAQQDVRTKSDFKNKTISILA